MSGFDPRNLVAWLAVPVCLAFALVLRRTGERGSSARKLALLLVVEGVTFPRPRETLGIAPADAEALERDLASRVAVPSPQGG